MAGMQTYDASRPEDVYLHLDDEIEDAERAVHCYSRLPMRQLLRSVPTNRSEMWWLSDHDTPRSVLPDPDVVFEHINNSTRNPTSLVILEGLDWLVRRTDEGATLAMLQALDAISRERDFRLILACDSLTLNTTFWARVCSLAPRIAISPTTPASGMPSPEPVETEDESESYHAQNPASEDTVLVHLVQLPRHGFTHAVLARRMLQWKRMGFDLAALEPAMAATNMDKAHMIYAAVESDITTAIDSVRLIEDHRADLSVSERERFNYRLMALTDVAETSAELTDLLSSR